MPARYWKAKLTGQIEREMQALGDFVRPESLAIDVGANVGTFTYYLARQGATVQAFEPLPDCCKMLRSYAKDHPLITVHQVALSDEEGEVEIFTPFLDGKRLTGWSSVQEPTFEYEKHACISKRLDDYDFRNVSVIKIDVEGHERAVILGALWLRSGGKSPRC